MKSRVYRLLNPEVEDLLKQMTPGMTTRQKNRVFMPWMGTFHGMCLKMLKAHADLVGLSQNFTIYDTSDQADAVKQALKRLDINDKKLNPKGVLSQISSAKNELMNPEQFAKYAQGYMQELVAKIYPVYQKILQENSAVDFDDLLMKAEELLNLYPDVQKKYQETFKYILIDEYQDTNHAQYKFAMLLASKHRNICVVGDDAQSIYSFRGANIQNILNFEHDFSDATVIKLEQNYRSTKKILAASNKVISMNQNQKSKNMWTENADGENITVYEAHDEKDEALWIAKRIKDLISEGSAPDEIVVLYRTNAQSRNIEEGLLNMALKYRVVGGVKFYSRKEVKDVLAYIRLIFNTFDNISLARVINTPKRGIGDKKLASLEAQAGRQRTSIMQYLLNLEPALEATLDKNLLEFRNIMGSLIEMSEGLSVTNLIKQVLKDTGYLAALNDGTTENENRIENLKELLSVAQKYDEMPPREGLETFLNEVALVEQDEDDDDDTKRVTLMTIHAAKGLEFEHVIVAGMEEGLFPHSRSYTDPEEMEEERRLAYVALTRAKKKLYLTYAESRVYFGTVSSNPPSRFMTDIPEDYLDVEDKFGLTDDTLSRGGWSKASDTGFDNGADDWGDSDAVKTSKNPKLNKGDLVKHGVFGVGMVVDLDDSTIIINFSGGVRKELALEYVQLTKVD
jgi:DNA helicase-2/ATP-dependent DNA helicase PcrA